MKSLSILACVLTAAVLPFTATGAASAVADVPACYSTVTAGTGASFVRICISEGGSILMFESPELTHHLSGGEGYAICSGGADTLHGYDAGVAQSGFEPPVVLQPNGLDTFPVRIFRTTTDGVFTLYQHLAFNARTQELNITMSLSNNTAATVKDVILQRYFDANVNNTRLNRFGTTLDSIWAWVDLYGLMLTITSRAVLHHAGVETFETWDPEGAYGYAAGCGSAGIKTPTPKGDYVGRATYVIGDVPAHASRTVKFLYRRF
jgi:hypothetical protein